MGDSNLPPSQNPESQNKRLIEIQKLSERLDKRAEEIVKEVYTLCLREWEFHEDRFNYQDKIVDILEELIYNVNRGDYIMHWYSYERPRALQIKCDKELVEFTAWLYYPGIHMIVKIEADIKAHIPGVILSVFGVI
jgi:hypothetical protein